MRSIAKTALAIGFLSAMALASTAPANAQGVYLNAPGVHVRIGPHHHHYYRGGPGYYGGGPGYYGYGGGYPCPRGYTVQSGVCKPYRGY